jgi:hypothetical protein
MQMFKLAQSPVFWATVETEITAEKGGRTLAKFDLQYRRLTQDEAIALGARIEADNLDARVIARELVVGWRNIGDDEGNPIEFNASNFERLLDYGFARSIVDTFTANLPKAKQKN